MQEPLFPMFFPILGAHVSGSEMQYPDLILKELCGQMTSLVADSGCNKGQLSNIVEAICRDGTIKTGEIVMQPRPYYLSKWYILLAKVAHIQSQPRPYSHVHCSGFHVLYSLARFGLYS